MTQLKLFPNNYPFSKTIEPRLLTLDPISGDSISGTYYLSTMTDMKYTDTLSSSGHVTPDYLGWHQVRLLIHTGHSSHVSTSCTCHVSLTSCFVSPSSCHVSSCHVIISCVIVVMCDCLHVMLCHIYHELCILRHYYVTRYQIPVSTKISWHRVSSDIQKDYSCPGTRVWFRNVRTIHLLFHIWI